MKCRCGNERIFLVRGLCEVCLKKRPEVKTVSHKVARKGSFVIRLRKNIYYAGDTRKNHTLKAIESGIDSAKVYKIRGPACKVALHYGGKVEEL
jgi:hypothetical protein